MQGRSEHGRCWRGGAEEAGIAAREGGGSGARASATNDLQSRAGSRAGASSLSGLPTSRFLGDPNKTGWGDGSGCLRCARRPSAGAGRACFGLDRSCPRGWLHRGVSMAREGRVSRRVFRRMREVRVHCGENRIGGRSRGFRRGLRGRDARRFGRRKGRRTRGLWRRGFAVHDTPIGPSRGRRRGARHPRIRPLRLSRKRPCAKTGRVRARRRGGRPVQHFASLGHVAIRGRKTA
jgi:hypothetical protein